MRLTCPNCSARYEVDDSMVPPEGRDVQCSNCATTWFQPGRRTDMQPTAVYVERGRGAEASEPEAAVEVETAPETQDPVSEASEAQDALAEVADTPAADADPAEDAPFRPTRREIDPDVREILRQEAEREARLRRGEADPVETQAEMPLDEEPDADNRARRRAELDDADDAFDPSEEQEHGSRRDLLPDIEEINSTLRATGDRSQSEAGASDIDTLDTAPRRRRGVRAGFLLILVLAALGTALYSNADLVAAQVPQAQSLLDPFVEGVNSARFWLDDLVRSLAGETT